MSPEETKKDIALYWFGALGVREETCMSPFVFCDSPARFSADFGPGSGRTRLVDREAPMRARSGLRKVDHSIEALEGRQPLSSFDGFVGIPGAAASAPRNGTIEVSPASVTFAAAGRAAGHFDDPFFFDVHA